MEILAEATLLELFQVGLLFIGVGFIPVFILSKIFEFFVALRSPPTKRAAVTVGLAYVLATVATVIWGVREWVMFSPLIPLPGSIGWFLYLRWQLRQAWYEDDELPEGTERANDSWQDGLLYLALFILTGIGVSLFRVISEGIRSTI